MLVSKPNLLLHFIFYVYSVLLLLKFYFGFNDGIQDIFVIFLILLLLFFRPKKLTLALSRLVKEKIFKISAILFVYYLFLSLLSYNTATIIFFEFLSVFKWLIYFFLGILIANTYRIAFLQFPIKNDILIFTFFVLIYSILTYNWAGIGSASELFGFYNNSYSSIFSLRSVFALFAIVVFIYALNILNTSRLAAYFLLSSSLMFLFMSGNRKMLLATFLLFLFLKIPEKYKSFMGAFKLLIGFIVILLFTQSKFYQESVNEYSNVEQPRVVTYLVSLSIAQDYFPIGSGPATFASKGSMVNYSPIYGEYGLNEKWGFGENDEVHFYNDTYWAQVIAQYGVIGLSLILWIFYEISKSLPSSNLIVNYNLQMITFLLLSIVTPAIQRIEVSLFIFFIAGIISQSYHWKK